MLEEWLYDSPPTPNVVLTKDDWDLCSMITSKLQRMMIDQDAPSRSITQTTQVIQSPVIPQGVDDDYHDCEVAHMNNDPSFCSKIKDCCSYQCALCKSTRRTLWKMSAKMSKRPTIWTWNVK